MEFSFGQVERALALTHNIADDKRSAFASRLKHLQKLRFPSGINTGRGRAASYGVGHLVLLGVALELNQLGLSPERAVRVIQDDMHAVAMAADMAARNGAPDGQFEFPIFLYCDPASLDGLTNDDGKEGWDDWASATFFYAGIGQVQEQFREWFVNGVKRMAFFSVSALLWDLATYTASDDDGHVEHFYGEVSKWADPFIHNQEGGHGDNPEA